MREHNTSLRLLCRKAKNDASAPLCSICKSNADGILKAIETCSEIQLLRGTDLEQCIQELSRNLETATAIYQKLVDGIEVPVRAIEELGHWIHAVQNLYQARRIAVEARLQWQERHEEDETREARAADRAVEKEHTLQKLDGALALCERLANEPARLLLQSEAGAFIREQLAAKGVEASEELIAHASGMIEGIDDGECLVVFLGS